ncbi:MAG: hypothetical protein HC815_29215 [Richelia sp. RM1_1_1]|nr:hypothetical protein [Richelia sp. SM1_7_0]NJN11828.1 hypothetical protein [Richelia sp. RM1_1_1]
MFAVTIKPLENLLVDFNTRTDLNCAGIYQEIISSLLTHAWSNTVMSEKFSVAAIRILIMQQGLRLVERLFNLKMRKMTS